MATETNEKNFDPTWIEAVRHAKRMLEILEGDGMNATRNGAQPTFFDPCKGETPAACNVYCDHCGMLGVGAEWRTVHISMRIGYRKRCPNCGETNVRDLREGGTV